MPTPLFVAVLVVGIVVFVAALVALPLVIIARARRAAPGATGGLPPGDARAATLNEELGRLAASGEQTVCAPAPCRIREGHVTRTSARVALTSARLIWLWSGRSELPLRDVRAVSDASSYNGETQHGCRWVVVQCDGREIGFAFLAGQETRWVEELRRLIGGAEGPRGAT